MSDKKIWDQYVAMEKERDALRAKIERMERQEPVGEIQRANSTGNYICSEVWAPLPVGAKLYALPGAQPTPSIPDVCTWREDESVWHSACGGAVWQFTDEGPIENGMKFCLACGKPLAVATPEAKP